MKTVQCSMCPATFSAPLRSSRKTCDDCRLEIRRMQYADYDKKRRRPLDLVLVCGFCGDKFQWRGTPRGGRRPTYCDDCRSLEGWLYNRTRAPRTPPSKRRSRQYHLRNRYGITNDDYDAMLAAQGGACAICGKVSGSRALHVDHDHKCCSGETTCGKCIRGLLCRACNNALGQLGEDCARIRAAADYLESHAALRAV